LLKGQLVRVLIELVRFGIEFGLSLFKYPATVIDRNGIKSYLAFKKKN
jgi:hypothetical protein